ncbi:hypothetical protein JFL43_11505 [Viridibacillus sp. YIM B01967]|uniref:TfoX N-terminal domain-containing protein n=1 Tax=Viridibacillus soli TaxID=2798301 RepID=A0ABS1H7S6_9BACL|nr:hypothetical protein [Viridibacillus soli]MBK3495465.1 hypothetical protein [Viridibacillus soli]
MERNLLARGISTIDGLVKFPLEFLKKSGALMGCVVDDRKWFGLFTYYDKIT